MNAFAGALFFMAIHSLTNFKHNFSRGWVFAVPAIQNVFTKNRFWQLWQNFYLTDNSLQPASTDEGKDKLCKLRPIMKETTEEFPASIQGRVVEFCLRASKSGCQGPFYANLLCKLVRLAIYRVSFSLNFIFKHVS